MRLTRSAGYAAQAFATAEEYLDAAADHPGNGDSPPDAANCMILDLHVPGMGAVALQEVLNRRRAPLPVIILSATDDADLRNRAVSAGAADVLSKPCDGALLLRAIASALGQSPPS